MKKLLLYSLAALALTGCGGKKAEDGSQSAGNEEISQYRTVRIDVKHKLNLPDSLKFDTGARYFSEIDIYMGWPEIIEGNEPSELQRLILERTFGKEMKGSLAEILEKVKNTPLGYEDEKGVTQTPVVSIPAPDSGVKTSALKIEVFPDYMSSRIHSYYVMHYFYPAGAAHGVTNEYHINYDVKQNKAVTIGQLFTGMDDVKKSIVRELETNRKYEGMLLTDEIPAPENFYVNGYSITFVFNPYEVAAYAAGVVEVQIPAYELAESMTEYGKDLFGIE